MTKKDIKLAFFKKKNNIEDIINTVSDHTIHRIYICILGAYYNGQIGKYMHLVKDKFDVTPEKLDIYNEVLKLKGVFIK